MVGKFARRQKSSNTITKISQDNKNRKKKRGRKRELKLKKKPTKKMKTYLGQL